MTSRTHGALLAASLLLASLGLVHSALGEILFFRRMARVAGLPVILGSDDFSKRTLRVTWHIPSIFGWALALILGRYSFLLELGAQERFAIHTISVSLLSCAGLAFVGTRGKHPAWAAFLLAAALCWIATG